MSELGDVVILNRDLFFGVRIGNTLRARGYAVTFVQETAAFAERLRATRPSPVLGIIDLGAGVDWEVVRSLTADAAVPTPVLVFGPHKDVDGMRAAKGAGVTRVVSNGEFHRNMVGLVQRYALPTPPDGHG